MLRFAANLTFLWPELDPYDRCRAAAEAGFRAVEILFPHELDLDLLERTLRDYQLELALFDAPAGDRSAGERGLLCLPGREDDFLQSVRQALHLAERFGTRRINVLAGNLPEGMDRSLALATATANLRRAAQLAGTAGVRLLIENISPAAAPGYFTPTIQRAVELVSTALHPPSGCSSISITSA
ncbi:MAG TPA: TIM barrel protein [Chloroflexota bacterium]|nr:TIM barrel protein [Chloroflexota bacterium]